MRYLDNTGVRPSEYERAVVRRLAKEMSAAEAQVFAGFICRAYAAWQRHNL